MDDIDAVGGKNASLGEMIRALSPKGVRVPGGFVVSAEAYRPFLRENQLAALIQQPLSGANTRDLKDLARRGKKLRDAVRAAPLPKDLDSAIASAYRQMEREYGKDVDVAVRSSATAEDLPGASFAGEHETYLGIRGAGDVTQAVKWAFASLFNDRAISYRADKGFGGTEVALAVGVQKMVRSDSGGSGVMFTLDTETGFRDLVLINAAWGLGELVVQGEVTPDEYLVMKSKIGKARCPIIGKKLGVKHRKMIYASGRGGLERTKTVHTSHKEARSFVLSDEEALTLASWAALIERHYSERAGTWVPMDIEWARDGHSGEIFVVQARPETVQVSRDASEIAEYEVRGLGRELLSGISVGSHVVAGSVRIVHDARDMSKFKKGEILVSEMTDPDWEPVMKLAAAIITDQGGRTSHAAIVARELGVPAIVGAREAMRTLRTGTQVTVETTGAAGKVYAGQAKIVRRVIAAKKLPKTRTKIMLNIASPDRAFERSFLPVAGVGLAREEFIIASGIGIHPLAVLNFKRLASPLRRAIEERAAGWDDPIEFYVDNLAYGIGKIGAAFYPRPVVVRFSDFKSNEYASLLGGKEFEPEEQNPMLGWRGASRYYDTKFEAAFALECRAIARVRSAMGLDNVIPMVPFCRTTEEARLVVLSMKKHGLAPRSLAKNKKRATPVYMMCEIPSNVILADEFLKYFDGMSIGSNDLTQLTLGVDRDSGTLTHIGNENDPALRALIGSVIRTCKKHRKYSGICGQGPSDLPEFAAFLVREGIESMSLNPDAVVKTIQRIARLEKHL